VDPKLLQDAVSALQGELPLSSSPWALRTVLLALAVAMVGHRILNWWRFRTTEQVHSRSCGTPHWVWWVWGLAGQHRGSKPSSVEAAAVSNDDIQAAATTGGLGDKLVEFSSLVGRGLHRQWQSFGNDSVPTGPFAWACSTILHPLLLALAGLLVAWIDPIYGLYMLMAAFAIFIKARIQKALVVEAIYDIFDARLEQVFMRGLERPEEMSTAKRAGMVVPVLAEVLPASMDRMPAGSAMPPEVQAMLDALRGESTRAPGEDRSPEPPSSEPSGPVSSGQRPVA
jgi:hypothetical protein